MDRDSVHKTQMCLATGRMDDYVQTYISQHTNIFSSPGVPVEKLLRGFFSNNTHIAYKSPIKRALLESHFCLKYSIWLLLKVSQKLFKKTKKVEQVKFQQNENVSWSQRKLYGQCHPKITFAFSALSMVLQMVL